MAAVNSIISQSDYNGIRNNLVQVMSTGSVDYGWGQLMQSSAVAEGSKVSISDWGKLRYDILNAYNHIYGALPTTTQLAANDLIRHTTDATSITASISGNTLIVYQVASGMLAVGQTISGSGVSGSPVITAEGGQTPVTITGASAAIGSGPYYITFTYALEPVALSTADKYTISGNSNTLYNGVALTATASTTTSITLQYDVNPGVYGSGTTTLTTGTNGNPWGRSTWTLSTSQTLSSRALTAENTVTVFPVTEYLSLVNTNIVPNRFTIGAGQSSISSPVATSRTWNASTSPAYWTSRISCSITVTFNSANAARHFFNSGGQIRITSSKTNFSTSTQNTRWASLLTSAGTQSFGGNTPTASLGTMNGQNWYRLTTANQVWYTATSSSPYGSNNYKIYARSNVANNSTGTATEAYFLVEFNDGYIDPDTAAGNPELTNPPGDRIDGTFTVSSDHLFATGIFVPTGSGNFTVATPTISIGAVITGS